jgi:hypothetical protein
MKTTLRCFLVLLLLLVTTDTVAQAQELILYDDFNESKIDPTRWFGTTTDFGAEAVRQIVPVNPPDQTRRELQLAYRGLGRRTSDAGTATTGVRLNFTNPSPITAIRATFRVRKTEAVGCAANPADTLVAARLLGTFFNIGSPIPGSGVNDVFAQIRIQRSSAAPALQVLGRAFRCTDLNCQAGPLIGPDVALGSIDPGTAVTLEIRWEPDSNRFVFRKDTDEGELPYSASDTATPGLEVKGVDVRAFIANCTEEQTSAFMDVRVDDVFVNSAAAP